MTKKLKLALVALLGFSAACSSVKNAPSKSEGAREDTSAVPEYRENVPIRVMYGVPIPRRDSMRRARTERLPEVDPVVEQPQQDSLSEAVGTKPSGK